jgi:hypothetical protein
MTRGAARLLTLTVGLLAAGLPVHTRGGWIHSDEPWVSYALPGSRITMRWHLLRIEGDELVIKVETSIAGEVRSTREIKRTRLRVPEKYRRESLVAGGKRYDCKVFVSGTTTYWYSEEVPLLGIVRSQSGDGDVFELVEASGRRPQ